MNIKTEIDYDDIFRLYKINRRTSGEENIHRMVQNIRRYFRKFLESRNYAPDLTWTKLSQQDKGYFICFEIKKLMLREHDGKDNEKETKKKIEKALKDYAFDNSIQNEKIIVERNNLLEKNIHKKNNYLNGKTTEKEKRQAYRKFCEDYIGLGYGTPPMYQEFIKYPQLSPYDHMMNSKEVASDCMEEQKSNKAKIVVKEKYARNDYLKDKHTEIEKKEAYKEFLEVCSEFKDFSPPSYDEFIKNPTRSVYYYLKRDLEMDSNYNVVIDKKYLQNDYLKGKNTEREKREAYKEFLEVCNEAEYYNPPSYFNFISHPTLSVYDYVMNDSEQDNYSYEEEKFINEKVNETVLNIVTDVLKKLVGLEIDYNAIRESVEHMYAKKYNNIDLSDSMNEMFNVNTEDYLKNIMTNEVKENQANKNEEIFDSHKDFIESLQSKVAEAQTKDNKENPIADNENQISESKVVRIKDEYKEQEEKIDLEEMKQDHIALKEREMDLRANQEKLQTLKGLYDIDEERLERINILLEDFEE